MVQCLAVVLLGLQMISTGSASGISARALLLDALAICCRLPSTLWLNGYLPVDASGDYVFQAIDIYSLGVLAWLLHQILVLDLHTYQDEEDSMPILPGVFGALILATLLHGIDCQPSVARVKMTVQKCAERCDNLFVHATGDDSNYKCAQDDCKWQNDDTYGLAVYSHKASPRDQCHAICNTHSEDYYRDACKNGCDYMVCETATWVPRGCNTLSPTVADLWTVGSPDFLYASPEASHYCPMAGVSPTAAASSLACGTGHISMTKRLQNCKSYPYQSAEYRRLFHFGCVSYQAPTTEVPTMETPTMEAPTTEAADGGRRLEDSAKVDWGLSNNFTVFV